MECAIEDGCDVGYNGQGGGRVSLPNALIEAEFPYNFDDNANGGYGSAFCDISTH